MGISVFIWYNTANGILKIVIIFILVGNDTTWNNLEILRVPDTEVDMEAPGYQSGAICARTPLKEIVAKTQGGRRYTLTTGYTRIHTVHMTYGVNNEPWVKYMQRVVSCQFTHFLCCMATVL